MVLLAADRETPALPLRHPAHGEKEWLGRRSSTVGCGGRSRGLVEPGTSRAALQDDFRRSPATLAQHMARIGLDPGHLPMPRPEPGRARECGPREAKASVTMESDVRAPRRARRITDHRCAVGLDEEASQGSVDDIHTTYDVGRGAPAP